MSGAARRWVTGWLFFSRSKSFGGSLNETLTAQTELISGGACPKRNRKVWKGFNWSPLERLITECSADRLKILVRFPRLIELELAFWTMHQYCVSRSLRTCLAPIKALWRILNGACAGWLMSSSLISRDSIAHREKIFLHGNSSFV
jgi:hypothetical protein